LPVIQKPPLLNLTGALRRCASGVAPLRDPLGQLAAGHENPTMDIVFILIILALYAGTHWLIWALSRLGGVE
jgi:hypothetical protein